MTAQTPKLLTVMTAPTTMPTAVPQYSHHYAPATPVPKPPRPTSPYILVIPPMEPQYIDAPPSPIMPSVPNTTPRGSSENSSVSSDTRDD